MLKINHIEGKTFYKSDKTILYTCVGYGINSAGAVFVVGSLYDAVADETKIVTWLFKDVTFKGDVTK